jgi:hypothetical protein
MVAGFSVMQCAVSAQTPSEAAPALNAALAAGDTTTIDGIIADNQNDPAELANIVNMPREVAQATKSLPPTTALLMAITVKTETFGERSTQAALNIVSIGAATVALLTNPTLRVFPDDLGRVPERLV